MLLIYDWVRSFVKSYNTKLLHTSTPRPRRIGFSYCERHLVELPKNKKWEWALMILNPLTSTQCLWIAFGIIIVFKDEQEHSRIWFYCEIFHSLCNAWSNHQQSGKKRRRKNSSTSPTPQHNLRSEFSIDAAHELARFIYDNVQIPPSIQTEDLGLLYSPRYHQRFCHRNEFAGERQCSYSRADKQRVNRNTNGSGHLKDNTLTKTAAVSNRSFGLLFQKVSFICPRANNLVRNDLSAASCAMYARPLSTSKCVSNLLSVIFAIPLHGTL